MSIRGIILKLVPARMAAQMEAESREWLMRCRACGEAVSIWDLGGLRYKAKGEPKMMMRCPRCGRRGLADVYRRRPAPGEGGSLR
jgi:DNA-directed RNA polymerase subunit RPC12/RpoP